jgi:hypothetical protein
MSYIPVAALPVINPEAGSEKDGDMRITTVSSVKVIQMWLGGTWVQIYPAVFA